MVISTREPGLRTNHMEKVAHRLYISIHLGVYNSANGNRYTGDWVDDKMHGQGIYEL